MATPFPKNLLVWIVAFTSMSEALLQAVDYWMDARGTKALLWVGGAASIFSLAAMAERIKVWQGE